MHVLRPRSDRRFDERGSCNVCGAEGVFRMNSWMLPRHAANEWGLAAIPEFARRESLFCTSCSSTMRIRRLAAVLLKHYGPEDVTTIADLVSDPSVRELDIIEVNAIGSLHQFLADLPRLRYTEYSRGGEDMQSLSYADACCDLILSSDTLEHIPDWRAAIAETRRVLRCGGRHVFTVPLVFDQASTVDVRGRDWFHGRGSGPFAFVRKRGDLRVHTVFAYDIADDLVAAGFTPEFHFRDAATVICATAI